MRIVFLHPFLGLGGAERLVVDAAVELQERGHDIEIVTLQHDPDHAFPETVDGTLRVRVQATGISSSSLASPRAFRAIAGMRSMARAVARRPAQPEIYFCDLTAHALPLLRRRSDAKVVFYCHFPDKLLAPAGRGGLHRAYRACIEWLEESGLRAADKILVNSRFTAAKFREAFPGLEDVEPEVVYPGVPIDRRPPTRPPVTSDGTPDQASFDVVSINRFDPPKNLGLAIEALAALRDAVEPAEFARVRLVMAGALDERLPEQVATLRGLRELTHRLGLEERVVFRVSISAAECTRLLGNARCLVYTPSFEHFGIVPIEAMLAGTPVVTTNSGGVRETVKHGETGFLCDARPEKFASAIARFLLDPQLAEDMGRAGKRRVVECFSRQRFGDQLDAIVRSVGSRRKP
mgnify:CR=1 FL=1